jgi:hypothetical protein
MVDALRDARVSKAHARRLQQKGRAIVVISRRGR